MTYWSLAVSDLGQDGQPVFNATRRLSDDEFERLSAANELFRRILGQTTWSVVQYNYSCFVLLEQQLRENVAARSYCGTNPCRHHPGTNSCFHRQYPNSHADVSGSIRVGTEAFG